MNIESVLGRGSEQDNQYNLFLDHFLSYIKDVFEDDTYAFEVCATDIWCLSNDGLEYEKIFITRSQNDKGIDAIVIPKVNKFYTSRFYYLLQVTMGDKAGQGLDKFITTNPNAVYPNLIPENVVCKKVILALGSVKGKIGNSEVISGHDLANLILETGNKFNIIRLGRFFDEYLSNVNERVKLWGDIHYSKGQQPVSEQYSRVLTINLELMKKTYFWLPKDIVDIITHRENQILDITTNSERERFFVNYELKIKNLGLNYKASMEKLGLMVGSQIGYDQKYFYILPTLRYLSIKIPNTNKALAHLDWSYDSPNAKHAIFGFKCSYENVKNLDVRIKPIENVNNHLNFKMKTALISPTLKDGALVRELIIRSKNEIFSGSYI